jgi:hypothetical protein
MCRALERAPARSIPVPQRLLSVARLGKMLRQQLGLPLDRLRELLLQHLRNPLVALLPGLLEE